MKDLTRDFRDVVSAALKASDSSASVSGSSAEGTAGSSMLYGLSVNYGGQCFEVIVTRNKIAEGLLRLREVDDPAEQMLIQIATELDMSGEESARFFNVAERVRRGSPPSPGG